MPADLNPPSVPAAPARAPPSARWVRWHRHSLRRTLLVLLSAGLLVVLGAELVLAWRTAVDAANAAYDRSLLGAIKAIDANISTASGGLGVELPYRMLEFFELTAQGEVYYRIATEDGLVEIGDAALPPPQQPLRTGVPVFVRTAYYGVPVRMGSYARLLDRPLGGASEPQRVIIQVAESLGSRTQFTRALVLQALARDLALMLAALGLLALGVGWALRPLARLRAEVAARAAQDLEPIAADGVPADVRPLVDAINQHVDRIGRMIEARRRFIDDASHQLRTPLATLGTQLGFALRETDPARLAEVLQAVKEQLDEAVRQTNQMLALARADSAEIVRGPVDLVGFAADLARAWWPEARQHGIDLGLDAPEAAVVVDAQAALLKEALANLVHNAIRHAPRGGQVTLQVAQADGQARLSVIDDGPGIPTAELARAGERFFRASNNRLPGTGLGLAIARAIAERHGGRLELGPRSDAASGLVASLWLPLAKTQG
mgnify:CR=1 FL=1